MATFYWVQTTARATDDELRNLERMDIVLAPEEAWRNYRAKVPPQCCGRRSALMFWDVQNGVMITRFACGRCGEPMGTASHPPGTRPLCAALTEETPDEEPSPDYNLGFTLRYDRAATVVGMSRVYDTLKALFAADDTRVAEPREITVFECLHTGFRFCSHCKKGTQFASHLLHPSHEDRERLRPGYVRLGDKFLSGNCVTIAYNIPYYPCPHCHQKVRFVPPPCVAGAPAVVNTFTTLAREMPQDALCEVFRGACDAWVRYKLSETHGDPDVPVAMVYLFVQKKE